MVIFLIPIYIKIDERTIIHFDKLFERESNEVAHSSLSRESFEFLAEPRSEV